MAILLTHYSLLSPQLLSSTFQLSLSLSLSLFHCFCAMANLLRSLALASAISHSWQPQQRSLSGMVTRAVHGTAHSPFNGQSINLHPRLPLAPVRQNSKVSVPITMLVRPTIQLIQGTDELTIPDVRLTKSRDGTNGVAIFSFDEPSVFDSSGEIGDITGFYMIDEEGVLQSVDVSAKFINGKPSRIEAKYVMRSPREWDRFMRFMERYANQNGLQFMKK